MVVVIDDRNKEKFNLERFLEAQDFFWGHAFQEIQDGLKSSHWIWFIFPQLAILGHSKKSKLYGISGYDEAVAYLNHPILGERLRLITRALLTHQDKAISEIFDGVDVLKVRSCMTLFDAVSPNDIFDEVLKVFYNGISDKRTLDYM